MAISVTPELVREAHARIRGHVRRTPLLASEPRPATPRVSFKLEYLQHAGSFKTRGAFNNLLTCATEAGAARDSVAAASGGNHGAAVAFACARLGRSARIFVPEISSPAKIATIRAHGAEVVVGGARYADAQAACDRYAAESGALVIHPFDADATLAGAGTVAHEWAEDLRAAGERPLDTVLVAVGGGGLAAGMAAYWAGSVRIVGVEPEGSRCLDAALAAGEPVDVSVESVAADSLGAKRTCDRVYEIAREYMQGIALVSDEAIVDAQRVLWRDYRVASEPGGAAALGALLSGRYVPAEGEHVGVLLCGANVDLSRLAETC